ncbi:DUF2752 domain-containing protein [Enterocloster aldenensis]|uniref:DUF2752 domain-containing protein n=1 Tax=Enterocloster aldenensis TaxID=358742 RepID=UPI000E49C943|nr:DUF2752 domain-containing protein [Enterocloster aldenensis]
MSCPFRILFGISCPGCGMSRAINALIHLHFAEAFHYHPLVIILPLIILLLIHLIIGKITRGTIYLMVFIVLSFIIVYFLRIRFQSDILTFDYMDGFIYKIFHNIIK